MTAPQPPTRATRQRPARAAGFTLVELLIVIGIIALLAGLALPMLVKASKTASITRSRSDLALIETALSAYASDFQNVYPQLADITTVQQVANVPGSGFWLDTSTDRGARLLCRALIGPGGAGQLSNGNSTAGPGDDGYDGPGFRARRNVMNGVLGGRVYGPYLQADKWKLEYDPSSTYSTSTMSGAMADAKLLDHNGNPVLYFPASVGPSAVTQQFGFVYPVNPMTTAVGSSIPRPLYNAYDDQTDTTPSAAGRTFLLAHDMQFIMGDRGPGNMPNGKLDAGETATATLPYLLWTPGPTGKYGLQPDTTGLTTIPPGEKCDAICNFDLPPDLRK